MDISQWVKEGVIYDKEGQFIILLANSAIVADLRGFGTLLSEFNRDIEKAVMFQDEIGKFIADAVNEKIERELIKIPK